MASARRFVCLRVRQAERAGKVRCAYCIRHVYIYVHIHTHTHGLCVSVCVIVLLVVCEVKDTASCMSWREGGKEGAWIASPDNVKISEASSVPFGFSRRLKGSASCSAVGRAEG